MQDRKFIPINPSSPSFSTDEIQNRWALLVGVNRYTDPAFSQLNFCVKDVLALNTILEQLGYTVACLHDELDVREARFPTFSNVEAELTQLCQIVGSNDLLWAHFACHGTLLDQQPILIVENTRYATLASTSLSLTKVEALMRSSKAKRLVLTLDACHAGVEMGRDLSDPAFIKNVFELAEGFALIAASTTQQVAQEWREVEHGVFTYYLLEGLSGKADYANKGFTSVQDLQAYVVNQLRQWNVRHGGRIQEPTFRAEGMGDMILADYRQSGQPKMFTPSIPASSSTTIDCRITGESSESSLITIPSPVEIKKHALHQELQELQEQYQALYKQISYTTNSVDRLRFKKQADYLYEMMTDLNNQLKQL